MQPIVFKYMNAEQSKKILNESIGERPFAWLVRESKNPGCLTIDWLAKGVMAASIRCVMVEEGGKFEWLIAVQDMSKIDTKRVNQTFLKCKSDPQAFYDCMNKLFDQFKQKADPYFVNQYFDLGEYRAYKFFLNEEYQFSEATLLKPESAQVSESFKNVFYPTLQTSTVDNTTQESDVQPLLFNKDDKHKENKPKSEKAKAKGGLKNWLKL